MSCWWNWDGTSSQRSDGGRRDKYERQHREKPITVSLSSISERKKKISDHLSKPQLLLSGSVPLCPRHPPLPPKPPFCTPPLLSFTLSFLSSLSRPTSPPPMSLQEAVVNQEHLPQSLWSSLCPRSLAEAGVVRRRRAADGGSAVNHCH